jgi:hypothetical protein
MECITSSGIIVYDWLVWNNLEDGRGHFKGTFQQSPGGIKKSIKAQPEHRVSLPRFSAG